MQGTTGVSGGDGTVLAAKIAFLRQLVDSIPGNSLVTFFSRFKGNSEGGYVSNHPLIIEAMREHLFHFLMNKVEP